MMSQWEDQGIFCLGSFSYSCILWSNSPFLPIVNLKYLLLWSTIWFCNFYICNSLTSRSKLHWMRYFHLLIFSPSGIETKPEPQWHRLKEPNWGFLINQFKKRFLAPSMTSDLTQKSSTYSLWPWRMSHRVSNGESRRQRRNLLTRTSATTHGGTRGGSRNMCESGQGCKVGTRHGNSFRMKENVVILKSSEGGGG